jgi:hypothetical protein
VPSAKEDPLYKRGGVPKIEGGRSPEGKLQFGRGPVLCTVEDSTVTGVVIDRCDYRVGKLQLGGICQATLITAKEVREYSLVLNLDFKEVRPLGESKPISFTQTYDKVSCRVDSDKLARLEGCKEYAKGSIRQCTACFREDGEERCYYAHLSFIKNTQKISRLKSR